MHGSMRIKSNHIRHQVSQRHEAGMEHIFKKLYRDDSYTAQGGLCIYCECPLPRAKATADHIIPRSQGGGTSKENIVASCQLCNEAKGSLSMGQFRKILNDKRMPPFIRNGWPNMRMVKAWMNFQLNKRTKKAERRIKKYVGMP